MEFDHEFSMFLADNQILRFGDFTLSGGAKSPYYFDMRLVFGYPRQFRIMIKELEQKISDSVGFDSFDVLGSVPTSGLAICAALGAGMLKPFVYVRSTAKAHGTAKAVEGYYEKGARCLLVDDVATSGGSVRIAADLLREHDITVTDAYVVLDRKEGAEQMLAEHGIKLHSVIDIMQIAGTLHKNDLITDDTMNQIKDRMV